MDIYNIKDLKKYKINASLASFDICKEHTNYHKYKNLNDEYNSPDSVRIFLNHIGKSNLIYHDNISFINSKTTEKYDYDNFKNDMFLKNNLLQQFISSCELIFDDMIMYPKKEFIKNERKRKNNINKLLNGSSGKEKLNYYLISKMQLSDFKFLDKDTVAKNVICSISLFQTENKVKLVYKEKNDSNIKVLESKNAPSEIFDLFKIYIYKCLRSLSEISIDIANYQ